MKDPKDMTREELLDALDALEKYLSSIARMESDQIREAAARLRKSIDRPAVFVEHREDRDNLWINHVNIGWVVGGPWIERLANDIRTGLGMEGGEG